jgi:hypothetical protein
MKTRRPNGLNLQYKIAFLFYLNLSYIRIHNPLQINALIPIFVLNSKFMAAMRKYPIGIQTFSEIIKGGFVYIDKTQVIHQLITSGKYYFLSRPRRFGKSLLLSTIKEVFSGSKELFKGLWIEDHWNWEQKHPVLQQLSQINYEKLGLYNALNKEMDTLAGKVAIGINFSSEKREIGEYLVKEL